MKKLNLGSGKDYRKGWINVDNDKKIFADYHFDLRDKFPFKDNFFDYILARDVLEHLTRQDAKNFLLECWRVLKVGAKIKIRTHNIFQIFRQFRHDPEVLIKFIYGDTYNNSDLGSHKYAYTAKSLTKSLENIGFKIIKLKKETTNFVCLAKKIKQQKKKVKTLISLQDSGGLGGAERFLFDLGKALRKKGVKVEFTVWEGSDIAQKLSQAGFITRKIPVRMDIIGNLRGLIKFFLFLPLTVFVDLKILKDFRGGGGKVLILTGFSDKVVLSPLAKILGLRVIWVEFAPLTDVFRKNFYLAKVLHRLVKGLVDMLVIPTFYTKAALITQTRISEAKMEVIPCGIEVAEVGRWKPEGGRSKTKIIGMVSRIETGKGQDLLIKAAAKLKVKNFEVVIVGAGDTSDLKKLAERLGMGKRVKFKGFVKDVYRQLAKFNVFVFPSYWALEGFGLVWFLLRQWRLAYLW